MDKHFIGTSDGKPKGIRQLIRQISDIQQHKNSFDTLFTDDNTTYTIYPVICHNDFHFGLPGINEYVNNKFRQQIGPNATTRFIVKNMTFINLDWLFDLSLRKGNFSMLATMIDRYWSILSDHEASFKEWFNSDMYLNSKSSFDEIYQHLFIGELPLVAANKDSFQPLLGNAGINQVIIDEVI